MRFKIKLPGWLWVTLSALAVFQIPALAEDQTAVVGTNSPAAAPNNGIFNGMDPRSAYFRDFFPQPLLVEETSLEEGELEFGSLHTQAKDQHTDIVSAGAQKSFGLLTMEVSVPYEWSSDGDDPSHGIGGVSLEARYPLYQRVSAGGFFDTTLGVAMEADQPVNSVAGHNTEIDPMIFNDLKLGGHFSLQSVFGWSTLLGGGADGGLETFEYGFDLGWSRSHQELPLPGVEQFTPMLELSGETELNHGASGQNSLRGSLGIRMDLKPMGDVQPGVGLGWVFPLNQNARAEVHWGIATSVTLGF